MGTKANKDTSECKAIRGIRAIRKELDGLSALEASPEQYKTAAKRIGKMIRDVRKDVNLAVDGFALELGLHVACYTLPK